MVSEGLLVRLEAQSSKAGEVEAFLQSALKAVQLEEATTAWFAFRMGRYEYGIFDVFPDEAGRDAHLTGSVARALKERGDMLLTGPPKIKKVSVLADKLPTTALAEPITKALLLTFQAKSGHKKEVDQFLRDAQAWVQEEPETAAWFALHFDDGAFGIFDVFPNGGALFKHMTGHVPRELAKHAFTLLGSFPDMEMHSVLAAKLGS